MMGTNSVINTYRISVYFLLILLVTMAKSGPARKPGNKIYTCSRHCRVPKESKFRYESEQVYDYSYKVQMTTQMSHTPQHSVTMLIEATANVYVISTCDMVLKLREVRIMESDPISGKGLRKSENSKQFRQELEKEALRFAFLDGDVSDVCPSNEESTWALNVKRGFLSAFQNNMDSFKKDLAVDETDVLGTCHTVYQKSSTGWFSHAVKRTRDLTTCTHKHEASSGPYVLHSHKNILSSLLSGSQDCQQTIDWNGILVSALCVEQRQFRLLTGDTTAAVTKISQTLKFLQKRERGQFSPPVYKRTSLEYEPLSQATEDADKKAEESLRKVKAALRHMCLLPDIVPDSTDLFYQLVTSIRALSVPSLRVLYEKVSGSSLCSDNLRVKKYFLDALAMAGTENSIRLLTKALTSRQPEATSGHLLLTTLHFLPTVTTNMLHDVRGLLDKGPLWEDAMLPVSSMVYRYCQQHGQCDNDTDVHRILLHFRRAVGSQCYANGPHSKKRERPQKIFEDISEHPELRIASYLTMMQCATMSHFARLQRTLAAETNTQVLSFVFSHLRNMKDTNPAHKIDIDFILKFIDFGSKDLGRLKLSRNFAGSVWSSDVKVASSLVWPTDSSSSSSSSAWIPRSLTVNLTLNFLGQALDLAEVGIRGEGLEFLAGEVLLPLLGRKKFSMGPKKRQVKLNRLKATVFARVLGDEVAYFQLSGTGNFMQQLISGKLFNVKSVLPEMSAEGKTSCSQSLVLIDQQVTVPTSSGLPLTMSLNSTLATQIQMVGTADLRHAFSKPRAVNIDGALKPSAALRITGGMSVDAMVTRTALRMSGTVHTNTILQGRVQIDRGRMVNVELDVPRKNMTVFDARTEITFLLGKNQYPVTSTPAGQRDLTVCTGPAGVRLTGLDLCGEVRLPESPSSGFVYDNIFAVPSSISVMLYKRDTLSQYKIFAQNVKTRHSLTTQLTLDTPESSIDRTVDLYLNANLKQRKMEIRMFTPWKKIKLIGSIRATVRQKDAHLLLSIDNKVTYGLTGVVRVSKDKTGVTYIPVLEVHHSGTSPLSLTGRVTVARFWRKVSFQVQVKGFSERPPTLKGTLSNSRKELSLRASAGLGGSKDSYSIACGTFVTVTGKLAAKVELSPFLFVNTPSTQLISLTGRGDYREDRSLRADMKLTTEWTDPVSLKYAIVKSPSRKQVHYRFDMELRSSMAVAIFDLRADVKGTQLLMTDVTLIHDIPALLPKDTITMVTKLAERSKINYWNGLLHSSLESKAHPHWNFEVKVNTEMQTTNSRLKIYYGYGADHLSSNSYLAVTSKVRHDVNNLGDMILAITTTAEIPSENVNVELKASHRHSIKGLDSRMSIDYGDNQQTKAHLILINKSTKYLSITGKAILDSPQSSKRRARRKRKKSGKRVHDFQLNVRLTENDDEYEIKTGAHAGKKKRDFFSSLSIKKPVSLRRVEMYCKGSPYSRTYQEFEAEFSHTMHPLLADVMEVLLTDDWSELDLVKHLRLLTTVDGANVLQKDVEHTRRSAPPDNADFSDSVFNDFKIESLFSELQAMHNSQEDEDNKGIMSIKGAVDVKSSFVDLVSGSVNFAHVYDGTWHKTDLTLDNNGDGYTCLMSLKDDMSRWMYDSGGEFIVTTPRKRFATEWQHEYDGSKIRSTYLTSWSKKRKVLINLTGHLERKNQTKAFYGEFLWQSPWKPVKDVRMSVGHNTGPGSLRSKSTFRLNGEVKTSHHVTFMHNSAFIDAGMIMISPWTKKVGGKVVIQHDNYPVTGTAELTWNPRHKVSVSGSASLEAWDDAQASLNIKTTIQALKMVSAEISNMMYGHNLVSEITAKYGNSKTFSVETVVRRHDLGYFRVQILSPLDHFRILQAGYQLNGHLTNMSASADFRIYPILKKSECSLVWTYDTDLSAKFRVDTPLKEFPYIQIVTTSEAKDKYRYSSVIMKYAPSQVYALNTKYSLGSLNEVIASVKTPHKSYDKLDIQIHQKKSGTLRDISMKISFPQDQKIIAVGQINMDWDVQGTVSLTTPFPGFETCGATFVYSFHGPELSVAANLTTDKRSVVTRVFLLYKNTDTFTQYVTSKDSSIDRLLQTLSHLQTLQKVEVDLQTAQTSQISESLADGSQDFNLVMLYASSENSLKTILQLDLTLEQKAKLFSSYSQNATQVLAAFSVGYGHDYLVSTNATILTEQQDYLPRHVRFPNNTPQQGGFSSSQNGHIGSSFSTDGIADDVTGIMTNFELHVPFLKYPRVGVHTNFQRNPQASGGLSHHAKNPNEVTSGAVSNQLIRTLGWAKHSVSPTHDTYFDISHQIHDNLHHTNVDIKTGITESDNMSLQLHGSGVMSNFSGTVTLQVNNNQVFNSSLKHIYNEHELHSALSLKSDYINKLALVYAFGDYKNTLTVNASAQYGDIVNIHGSYADSVDGEDTRMISVAGGISSVKTGRIESSTNVSFIVSEPLSHFSMLADAKALDNRANISFHRKKDGHMDITGRLLQPRHKGAVLEDMSEMNFTYKGILNDFSSSLFVDKPSLDPVIMVVKVDYQSLSDMETTVVVQSPFHYAEDLRLALQSHDNNLGETRALMSVGWAPYRQISFDVRSKHLPNLLGLTHHTDVIVITPFQRFQTGSIRIIHNKVMAKIDSSVTAKVNNKLVLDVGISSNDPASLGLRQPLLSLFQRNALGIDLDKNSHHMNVFIRWNLTNPYSKLNLVTKFKSSKDEDEVQAKDFSLDIKHQWKTLAFKYLSKVGPDEVSSEGQLTWDDNPTADKKLYYNYRLSNDTTHSSHTYHGHFKLGTPLRSVAANGSWVTSAVIDGQSNDAKRMTSQHVQGVLYWDADTDEVKHVTLNSVVTSGQRSSADIKVTIPMVSQTVHLKSDLELFTRNILWNSTTSLSYSPDPSKTLTFTTAARDTSTGQEVTAYSMTTALIQPSSSLDLGVSSRLTSGQTGATGSVGAWFLGDGKSAEKVVVTGAYNLVSKYFELVMDTPSRNTSVKLEMSDGQTYELKVQGQRVDSHMSANTKQLALHILLDPFHRSFLLKVNHDADTPRNYLAMEAWYVNDSAIRAELYRKHVTGSVTDSVLALHLNTSTLLHMDLSWRPELTQEIETLSHNALEQLNEYHVQAARALVHASHTVQAQLSTKWEVVTDQMARDLQLVLDLLEREVDLLDQVTARVLSHVDHVLSGDQQLAQILDQVFGEVAIIVRNRVRILSASSSLSYLRLADVTREWLHKLHRSLASRVYSDVVHQLTHTIAKAKEQSLETLQEMVYYLDMYLLLVKDRMEHFHNVISSVNSKDWDREGFELQSVSNSLQTMGQRAKVWLSPLTNISPFHTLVSTANELFQQGTWLYAYLDLDAHLDRHLESIAKSLRDIVIAEVRFRLRHFRFLQESRVTMWDLEGGKIQAQMCLPFPTQSLWTLTGFSDSWTSVHGRRDKNRRQLKRTES